MNQPMPQDPVVGPDPADPHAECERAIERAESEAEAARHARPGALSIAELHALIAALLAGQTFLLEVGVHHSVTEWRGTTDTLTWRLFYGFSNEGRCQLITAKSAVELYTLLRAAVGPHPLDELGDVPW